MEDLDIQQNNNSKSPTSEPCKKPDFCFGLEMLSKSGMVLKVIFIIKKLNLT